jgi:hypothetical protein
LTTLVVGTLIIEEVITIAYLAETREALTDVSQGGISFTDGTHRRAGIDIIGTGQINYPLVSRVRHFEVLSPQENYDPNWATKSADDYMNELIQRGISLAPVPSSDVPVATFSGLPTE